ncbi:MAG: hypothetical protein DRN78_03435 [Thermoproteota archaeon]|nr:MAG: hypothetical protein DRN78_03435 [Candidatus Korarchaeota archaeon]
MIEFYLDTLISLVGLLVASFAYYLSRVFKGSQLERGWKVTSVAGLLIALRQPFLLVSGSLASESILLCGLIAFSIGLYKFRDAWERVLGEGILE